MKSFKIPLLDTDGTNTGKMKRGFSFSKTTNADGSETHTQIPEAYVTIFKGRYEEEDGTSHSLRTNSEGEMYNRCYGLSYEGYKVYWFNTYGKKSKDHGNHVGMNWKQRQRFHLMQGDHWIQKEENIRYVINILFLLLGATLTIKSLFFGGSPGK